MRMKLSSIRWLLIAGVLFFVAAHLIAVSLEFTQTSTSFETWTRLFDLDQEYNFPTAYNGLLLGLSGAFAMIVFLRKRSVWWLGLFPLFIYLALDETFLIHEQIAAPLRTMLALDNSSPFFHAWVIPALALAAVLGIYLTVIAVKKNTINFAPNRVIFYVFALATGAVLLEILSTRTYINIVFYRSVSVLIEETYEMSFSSIILYQVLRSLKE
jgi:hypothetical protein